MTTACPCNRTSSIVEQSQAMQPRSRIGGLLRMIWGPAGKVHASANRKTPSLSLRLRFAPSGAKRVLFGFCSAFVRFLFGRCSVLVRVNPYPAFSRLEGLHG
jgi:hypothetical protein